MHISPVIFLASILFAAACSEKNVNKLPILGHREAIEKTVDGEVVTDTIYHTIPDFTFMNQDSQLVSRSDFDNKIYVADFFFTKCPNICPIMHRNMLTIYEKYKDHPEVKILSHTIDAKYDTPPALKAYANKLGVTGTQWEFVHGPRDSVYTIAEKSYLVAVGEDSGGASGGFVHQGWFILVDKEKRLRGAYEGTDEEQVKKLEADIQVLLDEYKQ